LIDKIRSLGVDTAVYGVSTILGRFLNFLLVPFYTNVLTTYQYGIVATAYSYIAFMNIIYVYGMESAYFKYASTREIGDDSEIFSTPFFSLLVTGAAFSTLIVAFSRPLARLVEIPEEYHTAIGYAALILMLDSMSVIPFAALRLKRKVKKFAIIKILNIVINVVANVVLLLKFHYGVIGIFISGVAASAATIIMLTPTILANIKATFNWDLYKSLLRFGMPYVPAGLAAMMVQVIDRPILLALTNESTVGIYQANYRLGIFMMLIVSMYDYAWRPFFLTHANEPNAKQLFARILTYFTLLSAFVILTISLYIDDLVKLRVFHRFLINPAYWSGLGIVPVVLVGYLFNGIYVNLMAGIYIEKKTAHLPYITGIGAITNVVANLLFIPRFGMFGAAWATLLAYATMAAAIYFVSQKYFPIKYELIRLAKIGFALIASLLLSMYRQSLLPMVHVQLVKLGAMATFIFLLVLLKFPTAEEIKAIQRVRILKRD